MPSPPVLGHRPGLERALAIDRETLASLLGGAAAERGHAWRSRLDLDLRVETRTRTRWPARASEVWLAARLEALGAAPDQPPRVQVRAPLIGAPSAPATRSGARLYFKNAAYGHRWELSLAPLFIGCSMRSPPRTSRARCSCWAACSPSPRWAAAAVLFCACPRRARARAAGALGQRLREARRERAHDQPLRVEPPTLPGVIGAALWARSRAWPKRERACVVSDRNVAPLHAERLGLTERALAAAPASRQSAGGGRRLLETWPGGASIATR